MAVLNRRNRCAVFCSTALALALALAACGGGGGGDDSGGTPGDVVVSEANLDAVVRVAVVMMAGGAATHNENTLSLRSGGVQRAVAASARVRPAAVLSPFVEDCSLGGTRTYTVTDVDDNLALSPGDRVAVLHAACRDDADESSSGTITLTVDQVVASPLHVVAQARFDRFAVADTASVRRVVFDGAFTLTLDEPDSGSSRLRIDVTDGLSMALTHPQYTDTLTLARGYTIEAQCQLASPNYGMQPVCYVEANGRLASSALGGGMLVWTPTGYPGALVGDERHPRAGRAQVQSGSAVVDVEALGSAGVHVQASLANGAMLTRDLAWEPLL